jgi:hypothetical protein
MYVAARLSNYRQPRTVTCSGHGIDVLPQIPSSVVLLHIHGHRFPRCERDAKKTSKAPARSRQSCQTRFSEIVKIRPRVSWRLCSLVWNGLQNYVELGGLKHEVSQVRLDPLGMRNALAFPNRWTPSQPALQALTASNGVPPPT